VSSGKHWTSLLNLAKSVFRVEKQTKKPINLNTQKTLFKYQFSSQKNYLKKIKYNLTQHINNFLL
jgi:hypothetical protein